MADANDPRPLTRSELAKFLPNQRAIRAFEKLFSLIPVDLNALQIQIDALNLVAEIANTKAQQGLDAISALTDAVDNLALTRVANELAELGDDLQSALDPLELADDVAPITNISSFNGEVVDNTDQLIKSSETLLDGAGASAGTLTNAPSAGDPAKWVAIDDNGTIRYIPAW